MITARLDKADEARFRKALKDLIVLSEKPIEEIMKEQGRLFARDAAKFTSPWGDKKHHGERPIKNVENTILSTYIKAESMAKVISKKAGQKEGSRFFNHMRAGRFGRAQLIVDKLFPTLDGRRVEVGVFDGGRRHEDRLKGRNYSRLVVKAWRPVTTYMNKKKKRVGEAKSGWAKAAEGLGGTGGIPGWAKKKSHRTKGKGKVTGRGSKTELFVANYSSYVLKNTSLSKLWKLRIKNMGDIVERMIKRRGKKVTRRT